MSHLLTLPASSFLLQMSLFRERTYLGTDDWIGCGYDDSVADGHCGEAAVLGGPPGRAPPEGVRGGGGRRRYGMDHHQITRGKGTGRGLNRVPAGAGGRDVPDAVVRNVASTTSVGQLRARKLEQCLG